MTMPAAMSREQQRGIEFDCQRALARLYFYLDESRFADLAALFAADGVWHRQGKALSGAAQIMAAMQARSATQVTRHVITNLFVTVSANGAAEAVGYLIAYVHDSGQADPKPIAMRYPARLFVMNTRFLVASDGCWIAEHKTRPEFEFPRNA